MVLSHDYFKLFHNVAPEIQGQLNDKKWKAILGLTEDVELLERFFELHAHTGELKNVDKERNVALRAVTIRKMMDTIYAGFLQGSNNKREARTLAKQAFYNAGHAAGRSFGAEMMETKKVWPDGIPMEIRTRLKSWCEFDSRAGFGFLSAVLARGDRSGTVTVKNNFLISPRGEQHAPDPGINEFMRGYLAGVLEFLLEPPDGQRVEVTIKGSKAFGFRIC